MALIEETEKEITPEQIASEGLTALDNKYQKSVGFFAWEYFLALGKILYNLWQKIIYISECLTDLSKMEYDDLVNFVFQTRGINAKTQTYANGILTVTNGSGIITEGSIFETSAGVQFQAVETTTVNQNDTFKVECLTSGTVGNVGANTINIIPTTIQGIVSVTNTEAFTNGYEKEEKEALLKRYYDDIQKPITSGNVYHYEKWALEVTGVGGAKIKSLWNGDNTVKVVIIDSNKNVPSNDLINSVQEYIDPYTLVNGVKVGWGCGNGQAPIGAYCTVSGATAKNITVAITDLSIRAGAELQTVKTNIENSIKNYFKEIAFSNDYVSYAKIGALIINTDNVLDYQSYLVNNSNDNVILTDNNSTTEIPVLTSLTITE